MKKKNFKIKPGDWLELTDGTPIQIKSIMLADKTGSFVRARIGRKGKFETMFLDNATPKPSVVKKRRRIK